MLAKEEVAIEFRQKLEFKEQEIESSTAKLARMSQNNIELTTRNNKLELQNQELIQENNFNASYNPLSD